VKRGWLCEAFLKSKWRGSFLVMLVASNSAFVIAQDIPKGPKLERYAQLWERNPFAPASATSSAPQPSVFDGLFLSSWLREDGVDVILVQNLRTNDVVRITTEPNQEKLRLVRMNLNPNPRLVDAVISDGKEERAISYRFDGQSPPEAANGEVRKSLEVTRAGGTPELLPGSPQMAQGPAAQVNPLENKGHPYRIYPGAVRVYHEGGLPQTPGAVNTSGKRSKPSVRSAPPTVSAP
jgi:hypothetical protein